MRGKVIKKTIYIILISCIFAFSSAYAEKQKGVKGKPTKEHVKKENKHSYYGDAKGLEMQKEKTADQEQKELGKGSEQGQASREDHRRKWWKFLEK